MLKLYSVFHLNLMYSSIETEERKLVIEKCYWPLIKLIEESGIQFGIESSGYTLEAINEIDKDWVSALKQLIASGKTELIGSGYSQIIGPIVPAEVNDYNQKLGLEVYQRLLNQKPEIALINEMSYSAGIVNHYLRNGYEAVMMEYNNPSQYHPEWEKDWRYYPQGIIGSDKSKIKLLWADSIAFQKFQRYVHGEINLGEYEAYLNTHMSSTPRYFPLYANDVEIFNFRPGRYKSEAKLSGGNEWKRISDLFQYLYDHENYTLIFPSKLVSVADLEKISGFLSLESPEQPIPVKKQKKYNINRWTLSGRNDLKINTKCFEIYYSLLDNYQDSPEMWKELCYLWSSDFRTHITEMRWELFLSRLHKFHNQVCHSSKVPITSNKKEIKDLPYSYQDIEINEDNRFLEIRNGKQLLNLNKRKGLVVANYYPQEMPNMSLFGTLEHGYYDDISLGADFFSGHAVIERIGKHKITDLGVSEISISHDEDDVYVYSDITADDISFNTKISLTPSLLIIEKEISLPERQPETIRPLHFTFNPESFDAGSLYYGTNNGGEDMEYFNLKDSSIQHHRILSPLITSEYGLGATNGKVIIGDHNKEIVFRHDMTKSALIPSLEYQPFEGGSFFLRLVYSAQEIDETFIPHKMNYSVVSKVEISMGADKI